MMGRRRSNATSIKSVAGETTKNESEVSSHLNVTENKKNNTNGATEKKRTVRKKLVTRIDPIKFKRKQGLYSFELLKFQDFL